MDLVPRGKQHINFRIFAVGMEILLGVPPKSSFSLLDLKPVVWGVLEYDLYGIA